MMARTFFIFLFLIPRLHSYAQEGKPCISIHDALTDTSSFVVPEISTQQLRQLMAAGSAFLLDTRPYEEWACGHLPGAINVAPKPDMPMSLYTSDVHEILRLVNGDKNRLLVLYCNGPFCNKSKRVSTDLIKEGFSNVMRYQGGTPVWRTTGNVLQIENTGLAYFREDNTAVWVDGREESAYREGSFKGAINIPFNRLSGSKDSGVIKEAKDDGRLPMLDHNTRIVVIGKNAQEAVAVSEAITKEAFHNVCYYNGTYQEAMKAFESVIIDEATISMQDDIIVKGSVEDEEEIKRIVMERIKAFNEHLAPQSASFTADADFVNAYGKWRRGSAEIESRQKERMQTVLKDAKITLTDLRIRFIKPDVALVHQLHEMTGMVNDANEKMPPQQELGIRVMVKENGKWLTTAFHNTIVRE